MTLMQVEQSPTMRLISKAAQIDPEGTAELVRLALYESLCDQVDAARPYLERDLDEFIAKRDETIKRTLVKEYVAKRQAGEDVSDILEAAAKYTVVSKDTLQGAAIPDNPKTHFWDARDALGRFASALGASRTGRQMKANDPFDKPRYANMRATGEALASIGDPTSRAAGGMMSALGQLGPEAEKVLGNGLRRTSYRYRGTEKRPNSGLKRDIKSGLAMVSGDQAQVDAVMEAYRDESTKGRALAGRPFDKDRSTARRQEGVSASAEVADFWRKQRISPDSKEMRVAGDLAAHYYLDKLPDPESVAISIAAGAVPPSQGVIIDADGDIVSEAMGVNGDHYVPFDLKNLRSLNGGQYVRTRAVGGPTTEDIYTGLLSGARQVQVVSTSGVFTIEFDPNLRGGKRYSDKARQMVGRYQRILDAINESKKSGLYQVDLTPKEKREIYQSVARDYTDEDEIEAEAERQINAARAQRSFKNLTDEEIDTQARALLAQETSPPRDRLKELRAEVREKNRQESVKRFQLDGDGYEAAMNALKTEFPFFVRDVRRERLPDFVNNRNLQKKTSYSGARDRGYVSPANAHTGVADSVRRTAYKGPERAAEPDAGEDTQERTEGAREASKPRVKASGDLPSLPDALKDDRLRGKAALASNTLAEVESLLPVAAGVAEALQKDSDFNDPDVTDEAVLSVVATRAREKNVSIADHLANAGPIERAKYLRALDSIEDQVEGFKGVDPEKFKRAAETIKITMEITRPFGEGTNPLQYDPSAQEGRPFPFPDIAGLGMDPSAYADFTHQVRMKEPKLNTAITGMSKIDPGARADEIRSRLEELTQMDPDTPEGEKTKEALFYAQKAYSFLRSKELAQRFHQLTGRTWKEDASGKAEASQEEADSLSKRQIRVHPPGSPLATEFRKFLAQRR